jgi:hypothetical protein
MIMIVAGIHHGVRCYARENVVLDCNWRSGLVFVHLLHAVLRIAVESTV